jgi:hypothetical protein
VIAETHEELVKKIEDVKQEAVAKIQAPAVSDLTLLADREGLRHIEGGAATRR